MRNKMGWTSMDVLIYFASAGRRDGRRGGRTESACTELAPHVRTGVVSSRAEDGTTALINTIC